MVLLGSSPTLDGIKRLASRYWYSDAARFSFGEPAGDYRRMTWPVLRDGKEVNSAVVVEQKGSGRYRLVRMESV